MTYQETVKRYFDTIKEANNIAKEAINYKYKRLLLVENEVDYKRYLNALHKDFRNEMKDIPFEKAKQRAIDNRNNLIEKQTMISCLSMMKDSVYGSFGKTF